MSDAFLGEIRLFGGNFAPQGWALCNGSLLSVNDFQALFSLIGNIYGGDGKANFALPNLNGSVALGQGAIDGTGNNYALASSGGSDTVTLTQAQIPTHTHQLSVSSLLANQQAPNSGLALGAVADTLHLYDDTSKGTTGTPKQFSPNAITTSGGSDGPHLNLMPYLTLTYIICTIDGLYPQFPS